MYNQIDSNKRKTNILIIIFSMFIIAIGWFLNAYMGYGYGAVVLAVVVSVVMTLVSYYKGDSIALSSAGAKETSKEENPYIYKMVENLAITAGMPMPKVYVINSEALNAFATGRDPEHSSIAVTTGIVKALENEELEGVLAHELSHIKNYDIRVMTIVVVLVGAISLLSNWFFRMRLFGGGKRDSNNNSSGIIMIVGLVLLILSPIVANLIKLAISRKREYLADASGSLLTRYPEGLARALEKISASNVPLQTANAATAHLFISNPFKKKAFSAMFSTHPPIEERIKKLRNMA
ncbi:MAG: zinc metalloprotease HtpX [Candidatus Magasanikbacteria bacterium CG_4_10_14_0_2_um_filter_33_14]|uniref:Protease HtpX homolog n=1 Tax=Candidatus Magasanikbacteria bacterium CG_4_10_14_0_2_um_filter_33_14 TaxID=1974636 RepID=A0A2M7VB58_9BACT|nr:MAG: zinc metalloprotease HtpX [Candidatus Magasanikbacteria bacterium CG_4_10_14_0_2_um_filter_33_14]